MILNNIISSINEVDSIAIMPHVSVDGDGLGSSLALGLALRKIGKKVDIYLEEEVPYIYSFLPGMSLIRVFNNTISLGSIGHYDMAIALDTGDLDRLGKRVDILKSAKISVNIDHHTTNTEFAFYNYVNTGSSAVGEIIHQLIKNMGISLDSEISACIYVAIATDTGGFRYSNTTAITHQITSDLINNGVKVSEISQKIFDSTTIEKTRLTGKAINSLELLVNGKLALIILTEDMVKSAGAKDEDCDGIVNLGRNIKGVEVSVMMRQRISGEIKVNLRSKNYVDVAAIAGLYKGGGHKRAAGCTIEGKSIEEVKEMLIKDIKEAI